MNDCDLISIITMTYRNFDALNQTVASALTQNHPRLEYLICDDGSDNFDKNLVNAVIEKYRNPNIESVRVIHHEKNMGTVKNLNSACRKAQGKYIILLSMGDVFVNEDVVGDIASRMKETGAAVLSYSRIQLTNDERQIRRMPCPAYYEKLNKLNSPQKQYRSLITGKYFEMASGSAICVENSVLKQIEYFDEDYVYWEDGPFFAKCNRHGIAIQTAYDIDGIFYRLGGISTSKSKSPVSIALRKDALNFYKKELADSTFPKTFLTRREIQYFIKTGAESNRILRFLIRLRYFDMAAYRILLKLKLSRVVKRDISKFTPIER